MSMDIEYISRLARIRLAPEERKKFSRQLKDILGYIEKLKELDVKDVTPMSHVLQLKNVYRQDRTGESLSVDKVLENTPQKKADSFAVPKVI